MTDKVRLNMEVRPEVRQRLEQLQEVSGADTMVEVVRRALSFYDLMHKYRDGDGAVRVVSPGGDELRVVMF